MRLIIFIALVFLTVPLYADMASVELKSRAGSGIVASMEPSDSVAMAWEKVIIMPGNYAKMDEKTGYRYSNPPVMYVQCVYYFTNQSSQSSTVTMGFPESDNVGRMTYRDEKPVIINDVDLLRQFRVWDNGKEIKTDRVSGEEFKSYWTCNITFKPYEAKLIKNSYLETMVMDNNIGGFNMDYILETGASWKGNIGKCQISLISFSEIKNINYTDFEPTAENRVNVNFIYPRYFTPHTFASSFLPVEKNSIYTPFCARDSDPDTAWVEGKPDDGIGEWIGFKTPVINGSKVSSIGGLSIRNGYQSSKKAYDNNNRIKTARVYFFSEASISEKEVKYELRYNEGQESGFEKRADWEQKMGKIRDALPKMLKSCRDTEDIVLQDITGVQEIRFKRQHEAVFVIFQIREVYPGLKYKDTCLSEIEAVP